MEISARWTWGCAFGLAMVLAPTARADLDNARAEHNDFNLKAAIQFSRYAGGGKPFVEVDPLTPVEIEIRDSFNSKVFLTAYFDPDPIIDIEMTMTNDKAATEDYTMTAMLPSAPFDDADWMVRATLDVTVTDENGDGAALTPTQLFISDLDPFAPPINVIMFGGKHTIIGDVQIFGGNSFEPGLGDSVLGPGTHQFDTGLMPLPKDPFAPTSQYNYMEMYTGFTLTPGDSAVVHGVITILLPGDYNGDGVVDPSDYAFWSNAYADALAGGAPDLAADGNGDSLVDPSDYAVWSNAYQSALSGAGNANVPEPATLALAGVMLATVSGRRR